MCGVAAPDVVLPHWQRGRLTARTGFCLPLGSSARHPEVPPPVRLEDAYAPGRWCVHLQPVTIAPAVTPRPPVVRRPPSVGPRCLAPSRPRLSHAGRPQLLDLPGGQRLSRRRSRRSAFADVNATRALLLQATERVSAILTLRQALVPQLFCDGLPTSAIVARSSLRSHRHHWATYRRPAVEAVTRDFLALTQEEFPPNQGRISVPLFLEWDNGLQIGRCAVAGVA